MNELFEACRRIAGAEAQAEHAPARPGDARRSVLDVTRAEQELGWRPQTPLAEGLELDVGLGPAATLVAIRVAFWLGAAATLIWAPAPDRRLIGSAYGPSSDFLFRTFAQWDARWFLQIAEHGYEEVPQAAAFFPVYPAAAHALAWLTGSTLVAGVLISLAAGAAAAWALAEIAKPILGARGANDVVLYLALYPVGFVLTALYSDGLFLALAAGSFLAATRGKAVTAGVLGGLATGTRLLGLALLPALVVLLWRGRDLRSLARLAPLALLPAAVGLYALYLDSTLGDPWAFTSAQADWDRETSPLGPLGGLRDSLQAAGRGARDLLRHPCRGPGPRGARRALEPLPSRPARRCRMADLGRMAPARRRLRRVLRGHARDLPLGPGRGLPPRQPPALPPR